MHESVMQFGREVLLAQDCTGKRVLEVGSQNVNGSLRQHIETLSPSEYVGVDFQPGAGVDLVLPAEDIVKYFGMGTFDLVVSTEMLEHCRDWRGALQAMFDVCRWDGVILLTARGPGCGFHAYPHDYWRFTFQDILRVFETNTIIHLREDWQGPGILAKIKKTGNIFTSFEVMAITQ